MENKPGKLEYTENQEDLAIRINAHKQYSNFSLEDWMGDHIHIEPGMTVLDIGCGSGNLFPVYAHKLGEYGVIAGIDKSRELLGQANRLQLATPKVLLEWDMNSGLPFADKSVDVVISTFAIYYVDDVNKIMSEIARVLKDGCPFYIIGPTNNNALELYRFNTRVFDLEMHEKANARSQRIESDFYAVAGNLFRDVNIEKIPCKLIFPDEAEYIKYYKASLLYRESSEKAGTFPDDSRLYECLDRKLEISKEMVVLWGRV